MPLQEHGGYDQSYGGYAQQGYGGFGHQQGYSGYGQHQLPSMPSSGGAGVLSLAPGKEANNTIKILSAKLRRITGYQGVFWNSVRYVP